MLVFATKRDPEEAAVSEKLRALLAIAGKVQKGGKQVGPAEIERAMKEGATDLEIHDTVLIAAAFCVYNRYVDGLATWAPQDPELYRQQRAQLATEGYTRSTEHFLAAVQTAWGGESNGTHRLGRGPAGYPSAVPFSSRQPSSLSQAERELIATYVSSLNDCDYCQTAHGAIAAHHLGATKIWLCK